MEGAPADDNFDALPLEDRLTHKVWKARLSAYTAVASLASKTLDDSDPFFREQYISGPSLRDWVRDANAVAQEKGVEAACAVVEFGGKALARTRGEVVPSIVEKCLGSARANTRTKAIELCLLYVEAEENMAEGVVADVVPGLDAKQPKVVAGSVMVLKEIARCFGPKTANFKSILKSLPKIFAHADKTVRSEGQLLCLALHSFLGPALTPHLGELKPVQQKELGELFEAADRGEKGDEWGFGKIRQLRFTVTQKKEIAVQEAQGQLEGGEDAGAGDGGNGAADEGAAPPDVFDLSDPIPILSRLPAEFYSNLSSSQWKNRKELALEPLLATLSSSPRYEPDNYADLVSALAGRMTDANVLCVMLAAQCIEKLAKGLRGDFARYKGTVTSPILARTKEKKQNVLETLGAALDAVYSSSSIGDFTEDVATFAKDKNPSVKASTLSFYTRCLASTPSPPPKNDLPQLIEVSKKALEDSDVGVRAAAADALGTLMKVIGDRAFNALIGEMDPLRKEKVNEAAEKAVTKCKNGVGAGGGGSAPARSAPLAAAAPPKPKPLSRPARPSDKENAPPVRPAPSAAPSFDDAPPTPAKPPVRGPPARLMAKKPPAAAGPPVSVPPAKKPTASRAPAAAPAASSSKASEPLRYKHSQEAAESLVDSGDVIPADLVVQLNDSNWKQRLEGMEKLTEWAKLDGRDADSELVVRYLVGKKPGPKESNFQVAGKVFALLEQLAADSPTWTKACSAVSTPLLCDKLGDIKLKKPASDALVAFAEKSSLGFVLSQAYEPMSKQKAPKTLAESYVFVEQALRDFGLAGGLAVRDLIEFLKVGLKHSNAAVRTSAIKALVTLRLFVGPDIVNFLSDLTPQLLSTIDSDFEKAASEQPPAPTRFGADTVAPPAPAGAGGAATNGKSLPAAPEVDPMDELFPRVDFDRLVSSAQIQACSDANWKVRKEALEGIREILEANKRLKPTGLPELGTALKMRITDANKIIQLLALDIVSRLATGMGKPFGEKLARTFAGPVAQVLADQKANIRAAGVTTLTAMADASGLEPLVGQFDKPLEANNPVQRKEVLGWLDQRLQDRGAIAGHLDLGALASGILACLEDRQADVRKSATNVLPVVIAKSGYGVVMDAVSKLKPASRSTVLPIVESARSAAASLDSAPAPPPAAALARPTAPAARQAAPPARLSDPPIAPAVPSAPQPRLPAGLSRPTAKSLRTAAAPPAEERAPVAGPTRLGQPRPRPSVGGLRAAASASSSRPASTVSTSSAASVKEPPFRSSDPNPKLLRHKKETGSMRWVIEGTPRPDQVDWLAGQMAPQVSATLHAQLFSTDHSAERDYIAALGTIDECARDPAAAGEAVDLDEEEMRARLIANFDLVVKYITLRIGLTSTTITVKCLDVIEHSIPVLSAAGYKASDYEVYPLLVSLINKVGDGKEIIRQRVRGVFKAICSIYPFSKVFSAILEVGLENKNARVRSECIDELGQLYARHGVGVHPISQALPKIASFIGKPDATGRTAALHAIGAVYTLVGPDATWKAVGQLPPKDRSMLEERLKRTASGAASPAPPSRQRGAGDRPGTPSGLRPPTSRLAPPASPSPANGLSTSQGRGGIPRPAAGIPSRLARPASTTEGLTPRKMMPPPTSRFAAPASRPASSASSAPFTEDDLAAETISDLSMLLEALDTDDFGECADVLKSITREITSNAENVLLHADALIDIVTAKMELGFTGLSAATSPAQLRLCKHFMQVLSAFFDKRTLSQQVSRLPLTGLLADLTGRLLDTADNPVSEPIQSLSKVLNMVLIRIFHNADQNVCFGALLTVLQDATVDLRDLRGEELADRAKYAELVMKCLWKVSKTVKESLENRNLLAPRLLSDINQFLMTIPPAEWRRRATDNIPLADMPLRTVKTILQQVVSVLKGKVFDELSEVDQAENSFVYQYLHRLANQPSGSDTNGRPSSSALSRQTSSASLGSQRREEPAKTSRAESPPRETPRAAPPPVTSPGGTDIAVNQRLKEIFDMIGDPNNSRAGIAALYEFQKEHPEAAPRIATWMAGTGSYFQTYLKRALANLEAADRERAVEVPVSPTSASSGASARPSSRPTSSASAAPGTPSRSSRLSLGPNAVPSTPQQSARLQELHSVFGFGQKE
ncbi:microtubule associated protein [Rhodotorula toruloides]|uniref:Microtubule associated protein n=1 Tax=Rhodotorula toruloides TaxID=5286 RepID=A0A511KPG1_RHOTO|nr:microtubule associated protein [Rhodotorula toruloides]